MENNKVVTVKILEKPFINRLLSNPFRYYRRAAGFTFCLVSLSNIATTLFDTERRNLLTEYPQVYFGGLLFKSSYFGFLWPSFYFTAIKDPRSAFVYAGGIEKAVKEI